MLNGNSLLCEVIAESSEELYSFTSDTLSNLDGIMGWRASIELMTVKRGFIHTPWAKWLIAEEGVGLSPEPPSFQE